jgi:hypothetical protein
VQKIIPLLILFFSAHSFAAKTEIYKATARDDSGKFLYIEKHTVQINENDDVTTATTEYLRENGDKIGEMSSDFTKNLTAPAYTFKDFRDNTSHGIRYEGSDLVLFAKAADGKEKTKKLKKSDLDDGKSLVVGCQGLHYYLRKNMAEIDRDGAMPIKFIIPAQFDYYNFSMRVKKETEAQINLKVYIRSIFLRLFAPSLRMKYDKEKGRLLKYWGLSNIPDDKGEIINVVIDYDYSQI